MKSLKITFFFALFILMLITTIWAFSQQNLFTQFSWTNSPMWFQATLVDFYINQFILWLGVFYLEPKKVLSLIWLIVFICFGSMGTTSYIIFRLFSNKPILFPLKN